MYSIKLIPYKSNETLKYTDKLILPHSVLENLIKYFQSESEKNKNKINNAFANQSRNRVSRDASGVGIKDLGSRNDESESESESESGSGSGSEAEPRNTLQPIRAHSKRSPNKKPRNFGDNGEVLIPSPLTFRIRKSQTQKMGSHTLPDFGKFPKLANICAGVKEFSSEENTVGVPEWMLSELGVLEGEEVELEYVELEKGSYARFRFGSKIGKSLFEIRSILESHLRRNLTTLVENQTLMVPIDGTDYDIQVIELVPRNAVDVVDTDLVVDIQFPTEINNLITIDGSSGSRTIGENEVFEIRVISIFKTDFEKDDEKTYSFMLSNYCCESSNVIIKLQKHKINFEETSNPQPGTGHDHESEENVSVREGYSMCSNCTTYVLTERVRMHENFCSRNNYFCSKCKLVMKKEDYEMKRHVHCNECEFYGSELDVSKHCHYFHNNGSGFKCPSCPDAGVFASIVDLNTHRNGICPEKVIKCRFCHTFVQQGLASTRADDILSGFQAHESYCGSRTIECAICLKKVQLRNVNTHMKVHNTTKNSLPLPFRLCKNSQCLMPVTNSISPTVLSHLSNIARTNPGINSSETAPVLNVNTLYNLQVLSDSHTNPLALCNKCFAPFYVSQLDPSNKLLLQRIIRKLHSQFVSGCGNDWCQNRNCATFNKNQRSPTEAATLLIPTIRSLSSFLSNPKDSHDFSLE
ncbi:Ubiquitin fusion degradation protein-like protein [Zancudomyces culisetae]|uniref:Ubiquitin fusion degradation protein-like protein n=1 Tax=Zancudomyces culisetae TaxID=1213189 RepID=A0A1R1PM08_ZANCU|nr:Ubiquitin fusion degradation protein-like protein [Zancudomyces culisetae]|eukprot:OMH81995.1 Ubiquitin fusion degradation protein-like protein [Zancudomyces culisetae]